MRPNPPRRPRFAIDWAELQDILTALGAATYVLGFFGALEHAIARLLH